MAEGPELINRSPTICHYTSFWRISRANCNAYSLTRSEIADMTRLFAENGLIRALASKVWGFVDAAAAFVSGDLGIGTQGPGSNDLAAIHAAGFDPRAPGRLPPNSPRAWRIEHARADTSAAMKHSGDHEEAEEVAGRVRPSCPPPARNIPRPSSDSVAGSAHPKYMSSFPPRRRKAERSVSLASIIWRNSSAWAGDLSISNWAKARAGSLASVPGFAPGQDEAQEILPGTRSRRRGGWGR